MAFRTNAWPERMRDRDWDDLAMASESIVVSLPNEKRSILHICRREMLRPLRDQILRISGFDVDSTLTPTEGLQMFWAKQYDLVLIDVEGEDAIHEAENVCSEIKTAQPEQTVAFVCNWRVALLTDCPDEILRTEFDPAAFASGVREIVTTR
jgi:CheY-like chemotaxis protein